MTEFIEEIVTEVPLKVVHNRIVKGKPYDVQLEINQLIKQGYRINSELFKWKPPGSTDEIFVQQLVLLEGEYNGSTTT